MVNLELIKGLASLTAVCVALVAVGCGGGDSERATGYASTVTEKAGETEKGSGHATPPRHRANEKLSKAEIAKLPELRIPRASGPPPRRLEAIDLRKGSGPVLAKTDEITIRFIEDTYPEALRGRQGGLSGGEVAWKGWALSEASNGLRIGLPGMRVGGRRELIVPPKVAYPRWKPSWGYAPYVSIYVVDLLGVEQPTDPFLESKG